MEIELLGTLTAAQLRGDLLVFKSVLARAEMNRNGDKITPEGIGELASSLPLMPLTYDNHRDPTAVCGHYIDAAVSDDGHALKTTAVLYASRFPNLAKDIRDGKLKQSVECHVTKSECLDCGSVYAGLDGDELCEHMMAGSGKRKRLVTGLSAFGGCLVTNPAGTGCDIDRTSLRMLASLVEEADLTLTGVDTNEPGPEGVEASEGKTMDKPTDKNPDPDKDGDDDTSPEGDTDKDFAGKKKAKDMAGSKGLTVTRPKGAKNMDVQCNACGEHVERGDIVFASDMQALRDEIAVLKQKEVEAVASREAAITERDSARDEFNQFKAGIEMQAKVAERLEVVAALIGKDRADSSKDQIGGFTEEGFQFFVDSLKAAVPAAPKAPPMPVKGSFGVRGADVETVTGSEKIDETPKEYKTFADFDFKYEN